MLNNYDLNQEYIDYAESLLNRVNDNLELSDINDLLKAIEVEIQTSKYCDEYNNLTAYIIYRLIVDNNPSLDSRVAAEYVNAIEKLQNIAKEKEFLDQIQQQIGVYYTALLYGIIDLYQFDTPYIENCHNTCERLRLLHADNVIVNIIFEVLFECYLNSDRKDDVYQLEKEKLNEQDFYDQPLLDEEKIIEYLVENNCVSREIAGTFMNLWNAYEEKVYAEMDDEVLLDINEFCKYSIQQGDLSENILHALTDSYCNYLRLMGLLN